MRKKRFIMPKPSVNAPELDAVHHLQRMSKQERRQLGKSTAVQKYIHPVIEREKKLKRQHRRDWWWSKGTQLVSLLFALLAAITGIIAILQ